MTSVRQSGCGRKLRRRKRKAHARSACNSDGSRGAVGRSTVAPRMREAIRNGRHRLARAATPRNKATSARNSQLDARYRLRRRGAFIARRARRASRTGATSGARSSCMVEPKEEPEGTATGTAPALRCPSRGTGTRTTSTSRDAGTMSEARRRRDRTSSRHQLESQPFGQGLEPGVRHPQRLDARRGEPPALGRFGGTSRQFDAEQIAQERGEGREHALQAELAGQRHRAPHQIGTGFDDRGDVAQPFREAPEMLGSVVHEIQKLRLRQILSIGGLERSPPGAFQARVLDALEAVVQFDVASGGWIGHGEVGLDMREHAAMEPRREPDGRILGDPSLPPSAPRPRPPGVPDARSGRHPCRGAGPGRRRACGRGRCPP